MNRLFLPKTELIQRKKRRITWRDRPDFIQGRYFIITFALSLFYLIGAGVGYKATNSWICLLVSGFLGGILLLLSFGHAYDFYNGASIEGMYLSIPFLISFFTAIFMSCIYGLGAAFKMSLPIAIVTWLTTVLYFYGVIRDFNHGSYYAPNKYISVPQTDLSIANMIHQMNSDQINPAQDVPSPLSLYESRDFSKRFPTRIPESSS